MLLLWYGYKRNPPQVLKLGHLETLYPEDLEGDEELLLAWHLLTYGYSCKSSNKQVIE